MKSLLLVFMIRNVRLIEGATMVNGFSPRYDLHFLDISHCYYGIKRYARDGRHDRFRLHD